MGLNPRSVLLDLRGWCGPVHACLAAWMLACTHLAIAQYLLAAGHLRLCHSFAWQARKRRNSCPQDEQSEPDD